MLLANPKLGSKRVCQSCENRFYDLRRSPIVCPSCGATFDPEAVLRSRRVRPSAAATTVVPKVDVIEAEVVNEEDTGGVEVDDNAIPVDDTDEEEVIGDTSDLGGEDDFNVSDVTKSVDDEET
jgi:uncharacterized protein (TIGR02300 family)